jgi:hypothetical protein
MSHVGSEITSTLIDVQGFLKEATLLLQAIRYQSLGQDWPAATSIGLVFFASLILRQRCRMVLARMAS